MRDQDKTRRQLLDEVAELRRRVAMFHAEEIEQQRFRNYFEQGLIGMAMTGLDKRWLQVNDRLCEILGYSREELYQRTWAELTYADDLGKDEAEFDRLLGGEIEHYRMDKRFVHKNGAVVHTRIFIRAFRKESCAIDHIVALIEDVTAQQRAEQSLRQSHEELRAIYDNMVDGLLIADLETRRLVRANDSVCRMLGYSKDELLSKSIEDIHPHELVPACLEAVQAHVEGRIHVNPGVPILRKDGTVFYADIAARGLVYAGRRCIVGFFRDITDRQQSQEELRRSEEKYRRLVEACPDTVVMADLEGIVSFVSHRGVEQHGASRPDQIIGRSATEFVAEGDRERTAASLGRLLEEGVVRNEEFTFIRRDGAGYAGELSAAVIHDASGTPSALMAIIRDVTERKKAVEALQQERRTLEHMLRASDHERQLIAYDIHDGLAQYLAGAIMQFETFNHVKDTQPGQAADAFRAGMTMLRQSHFEARRMISGLRPPILDEAGVLAAIGHLVNDRRFEGGPRIEVRSRVSFTRLAPILENAIYRIVQEGLNNACKHSRSEEVCIGLVQREDQIRIEVQDWGVGFDPKATPENRYGLAGIRQRCRLLGGRFRLRTKAGEGTSIVAVLPLVEAPDHGR